VHFEGVKQCAKPGCINDVVCVTEQHGITGGSSHPDIARMVRAGSVNSHDVHLGPARLPTAKNAVEIIVGTTVHHDDRIKRGFILSMQRQ
jgi:hypothetical protein